MELVTPAIGLIFWTTVVFTLLVLLLKKFAWKPILSAVDERNQSIKNSLAQAEKARNEMSELTANNEKIIAQAKVDRDVILKEARDMKNEIISEAKDKASKEAERKRIEAEGIRDFQNIVSQSINDDLLKWKGIEATTELSHSNNAKVVVIGSGENGLPLILGD